ncbi:MAG: peptide deformylase [Bacteroidales bacterium]|jgi:peptide deformylase|nr:peptide deformylase [Bacteroidales bacterium]
MKKLSVIILISFLSISLFAQESIEIDFEINQNSNQLVLDSVLIENTTATCDTMIYYPNTTLNLNMLSGIEELYSQNKLHVRANYPNPFDAYSIIELYVPEQTVQFSIYDIQGKSVLEKEIICGSGLQQFKFHAGAEAQYLIKVKSGNQNTSLQLMHSGDTGSKAQIEHLGKISEAKNTTQKANGFSFTSGDQLNFTAWVIACGTVESTNASAQPEGSEIISFDFTHLSNLQASTPEIDEIIPGENEITWKWSDVSDSDGYKYAYVNDYETATDIGTTTQMTTDDLSAGTNYKLFIWAYNDCGESHALEMYQATSAIPFTQDENDTITNAPSNSSMAVMNIFEQPDSIILRTPSTNVLFDEENLDYLVERMQSTVSAESGVGIAAPQVGINRLVIWVQRYDIGAIMHPWEVYYNPRIVNYSDTVVYKNDGCLSVPTSGDYPEIEGFSYRAIWVDVEYYTETGEKVVERINHQYTAHIFQHEIDHLNAVMFFDRQVEEGKDRFTIIEGDSYEGLPTID